jgi:hypothetical protein
MPVSTVFYYNSTLNVKFFQNKDRQIVFVKRFRFAILKAHISTQFDEIFQMVPILILFEENIFYAILPQGESKSFDENDLSVLVFKNIYFNVRF